MRRTMRIAGACALTALAGCATGPLLDNPAYVRGEPPPGLQANPAYVAGGPPDYGAIFERVIDVLDDSFEIAYSNRYDGTIRTFPKQAPGLEQPWKPGAPEFRERLEATVQTIRYRAEVQIQPAEQGGFLVNVAVYKELEDIPRPIRATAGAASFRSDLSVERQYEVLDPQVVSLQWVPKGREIAMEQEILRKIYRCFR